MKYWISGAFALMISLQVGMYTMIMTPERYQVMIAPYYWGHTLMMFIEVLGAVCLGMALILAMHTRLDKKRAWCFIVGCGIVFFLLSRLAVESGPKNFVFIAFGTDVLALLTLRGAWWFATLWTLGPCSLAEIKESARQ